MNRESSEALLGLRSLLFVPGNRADRIEKALASEADLVCIDLEDAVPVADKAAARAALADRSFASCRARSAVRVNPIDTQDGARDLLAIAEMAEPCAFILLPKVASAAHLEVAAGLLAGRDIGLIAMIETAQGLHKAAAIARAGDCRALMFGGADLSVDLGASLAWEPLYFARATIVQACGQASIPAIDMPYLDLVDPEGLQAEAVRARSMGFAAKAAIHPSQLPAIRAAFGPGDAEISYARAAIEAFDAAGGSAVSFRGQALDIPIVRQFRRIIAAGERSHA